jgi:hypothetical protein
MLAFASTSLVFLFQCFLISVTAVEEGNLKCNHVVDTDHRRFSLADCRAAINMIPSGNISFDLANSGNRSRSKPVDVYLDRSNRKGPFLLPAAFRSRSCVVLVGPPPPQVRYSYPPPFRSRFQPPVQAASAMYSKVWPEARRAATMIIERCQLRRTPGYRSLFNAGSITGNVLLDGQQYDYNVMVRPAPRKMPGEGWKVYFYNPDHWYNVYEADGAPYSLPTGYIRGLWTFRDGPGRLIRHGYRGPAVHVIQPVTQPVFREGGPSPMDWLESNATGC